MSKARDFFTAREATVGELIKNTQLNVPEYQRDFAWGEEQFDKLWGDIENVIDTGSPHFMGAVVLEMPSSYGQPKDVMDGQQRLTTLTILYSVLHEFSKVAKPEDRPTFDMLILSQIFQSTGSGERISRITLNSDNSFYYDTVVQRLQHEQRQSHYNGLPSHKKTRVVERIRSCWTYFHDQISRALEKAPDTQRYYSQLVKAVSEELLILEVEVKSQGVAYTVFEVLNDRGLELSQADLIKNAVLRAADQKNSKPKALDSWKEMRRNLPDDGKATTAFIRFHYNSNFRNIRSNDVYDEVNSHIQQKPLLSYLQSLQDESINYSDLLQTTERWSPQIQQHLKHLRELNITHGYPLLLAGASVFENNNESFGILVKATLHFCFRFLTIGKNKPGQLETIIGRAARKLRDSSDLEPILVELRENSTDKQFMMDFEVYSARSSRIGFFVLRGLEEHLSKGQGIKVLDQSPAQHLEHIMPKKLGKGWTHIKEDEHSVFLNRIGNLLVLEADINKYVSNRKIAEKFSNENLKDYESSRLRLPTKVPDYLSIVAAEKRWDIASIEKRQVALAAIAPKAWAIPFPSS